MVNALPVGLMARKDTKDCPYMCAAALCSRYSADAVALFKRVGPDLFMYRTNGRDMADQQRFVRAP